MANIWEKCKLELEGVAVRSVVEADPSSYDGSADGASSVVDSSSYIAGNLMQQTSDGGGVVDRDPAAGAG